MFGIVDDITLVSIPAAMRGRCEHSSRGTVQQFHLLVALAGHHVEDDETRLYASAVVALPPVWAAVLRFAPWRGSMRLPSGDAVQISMTDGSLRLDVPAMTRTDIDRQVIEPVRTLLMLLSGTADIPLDVHLVGADQAAMQVRVWRAQMPPTPTKHPELALALHHISLSNLEAWYHLTRQVSPLTSVVRGAITARNVNVEIKVLLLAAAAESFHRELHDERIMTKAEAKATRKAAVAAVPDSAKQRVETALAHIGEMTFSERLNRLLETIGTWANEVAGPSMVREPNAPERRGRDLWVRSVRDARNGSAHLLPHYADDVRKYTDELYVLFESLRWFMTALMMLHIGVPSSVVQSSVQGTSAYDLFRGRAVMHWPNIYRPATITASQDDPPATPSATPPWFD
jgi:hypothetical protein